MIHAYDKDYLYYAQNNLGHMVDFAVNTCEYSLDEFFEMFRVSNVCKQFEEGNPSYLVGKTGCELARLVILEVKEKEIQEKDIMYMDRSPEYWLGWSLAYYVWEKNCRFDYIFRVICPENLIGMYDTLHEADISKFVIQIDNKLKEYYDKSMLARLRTYANLSQSMLAEKSGINIRIIQSYEQGMRDINKAQFSTIIKLAKALNCEPIELLEKE